MTDDHNQHHMHLDAEPFAAIAAGRKTVELRVNDAKRQKVKVGDTIEFEQRGATGKTLLVRVTELQRAPNFEALVKAYKPAQLGVDQLGAATLVMRLSRAYGAEVKEFGCVGLGFSLLRAS